MQKQLQKAQGALPIKSITATPVASFAVVCAGSVAQTQISDDMVVISADHQNKPDVGVNIARNWYDNEKVDAIFDVPTSSVALPAAALSHEKNKINIKSGGGSSDLTGVAYPLVKGKS